MKIAVFSDFDIYLENFEAIYAKEEEEFFDLVLNKKRDVLIVSVNYLKAFLEIKRYINAYVIFITDVCNDVMYKKVLEFGDDCFLYYEKKIVYRLAYLRKKMIKSNSDVYKNGDILYNFNTKTLYINSEPIVLSRAEKELVETLIKYNDSFIDKYGILEECDSINNVDSIKVLISKLRKIGLEIDSIKNLGYKLKTKEDK